MTHRPIQVEKGVPLPARFNPRGGGPKYPFADLSPGDSFFVPANGGLEVVKTRQRLSNYANNKRLSHAKGCQKYSVRTVDGGVRVWRTA